ncbi:cation transporter [Polaribacter litorisediminis]|uniref:cation transporter n=1 Tax=Polaribacter litorisediminis TaxID=1908341 RepID=UPI001CBDCC09|nr:heavy metal-associated domain-containing protein [Polaribacter litorisediminis]UAM97614.1 cation transporter [Polaribacter litorisediminis]
MKIQKVLSAIAIACFVLIGCKDEVKKEVKKEQLSLAISGMTCEIGCAKTIQSKLSKKEGVLNAKVIFTDSIANIEFDSNTTSKTALIAFVDGIAGGDLYKASEASIVSKKAHVCSGNCKENCEMHAASESTKKAHACSDACKEKCEMKAEKMKAEKMTCKEDCTMACCKDKKA